MTDPYQNLFLHPAWFKVQRAVKTVLQLLFFREACVLPEALKTGSVCLGMPGVLKLPSTICIYALSAIRQGAGTLKQRCTFKLGNYKILLLALSVTVFIFL